MEGNYIRIPSRPILTYLTSSLQTSLQNQTKHEGNEKDDFIEEWVKFSSMSYYKMGIYLNQPRVDNLKIIYTRPFFIIGPRKIGDVSSDFARKIVEIENKKSQNPNQRYR